MSKRPLFRRVTQIGLVVRSAEETALRCWKDFGLGPWRFYTLGPGNVKNMTMDGKTVQYSIRTAHATIGEIDWEIIEPMDDLSVYAQHLNAHGEGLHHILFDVDDYHNAKTSLENMAYREQVSGIFLGAPYSYFDTTKALGCIAEIWAAPKAGKLPILPELIIPSAVDSDRAD